MYHRVQGVLLRAARHLLSLGLDTPIHFETCLGQLLDTLFKIGDPAPNIPEIARDADQNRRQSPGFTGKEYFDAFFKPSFSIVVHFARTLEEIVSEKQALQPD